MDGSKGVKGVNVRGRGFVPPAYGKGMKLKYKMALTMSLVIFVVMGLVTAITVNREVAAKKRDADLRIAGIVTVIKLTMGKMPTDDFNRWVRSLYSVKYETVNYNLDLIYIVIENGDGEDIVSSVNPRAGLEGAGSEAYEGLTGLKNLEVKGLKKVEASVMDKNTGDLKYSIYLGYYLKNLQKGIWEMAGKSLAVTFLLIVFAVTLSFYFSNRLTRPIDSLVSGMEMVAGGDFAVRVPAITKDEIGFLAESFNKMTEGLKEREFIKDTFKRYVTREIADQLLSQKNKIVLTGEKRVITVLFADIKGFTTIAEKTPPVELVSTLNDYFSVMIDIIFKYEGVLDKFIGDAVMAFWNAPLEQKHPPLRAVMTALEMQGALGKLNERRERQGKHPLYMGIGINTGEAVAGIIGSERKMEYTVIGDTVNVAQRLESITEKGQILVSETTYMKARERLEAVELGPQALKGLKRDIKVFNILGVKKGEGEKYDRKA
ncbi:MAG: HAMP domain-containing protein [Deltaproteobacteria bacterium]|uniref:HAMP domain-containing protein n=1 Tax=Candidatus Zymogenus saltonus TaxID=2844893 RepID=A0A9D8KF86_9DELT|nr:HAMP domain-containing protein [Candidatus Zymogenus saltonus]